MSTCKRFAAKRDENEPEISDALKSVGASVEHIGQRGVPDLLVGYRGATHLLEVKVPEILAPGLRGRMVIAQAAGKLTPAQVEWHRAWRGRGPVIVTNIPEALAAVGFGLPSTTPSIDLEVAEFLAGIAGLANCGDWIAEGLAQQAMRLIRKTRAA